MKLTAEDRIHYARACWDTFCAEHKVKRFGMTPAEFHLVGKWMDAQVPLMIALRGITETGGKPGTLLACEEAVSRAFAYYRQAMAL